MKIEIDALVALNDSPDANLWRVKEYPGKFDVGLIDASIEDVLPNQRVQWVDISLIKKPTKSQLINHANR